MALCLTRSLFLSACQWLSTFFFAFFPFVVQDILEKSTFAFTIFMLFFSFRVAAFPLIDVCNFTPYEQKPGRGQHREGNGLRCVK